MSIINAPDKLLTAEEFLALPEDPDSERMLIGGRVIDAPVGHRSWIECVVESHIVHCLFEWRRTQASLTYRIASGAAGCRLRNTPDSVVGIDVAVFARNAAPQQDDKTTLFMRPPVLAVEILSPSDVLEHVQEKVSDYLTAGVPLVWIVDPHFRTVVVHRPDAAPEMFTGDEELSGEPHLPGLKIAVRDAFADL